MIVKTNITIVIADDHPMILKGLHDELIESNYNVVGQGINGKQALELIITHNPTIALLDIDMPILNGFEVIKKAKNKNVDTKFIVLSFYKENDYILQAKTLEINGYLLKEDSFSEIENCIENVLEGQICFSKSFAASSLRIVSEELKKIDNLTSSEKTILKLIAQQITTQEIAEQLFISKRTVEKHRSNITIKLEISNDSYYALGTWAYLHKNAILEL
ncbi:response regulator containing a CheY-like receiver domain and an HTH DNA-binding domain [Aequorivita sublithincola DSM 14238]|uniref:Response regulator containing a CheY-like receiver domain and an HTH DNA-binding domain n=1 Tax=Aequorivita sublithincola (strain DSM 14238 / LMG 21431 / ACAM 643 / 9-3) TaxID=746697 RepID=I3YV46_AEQSU|nr:response regulator transcription factor [Aequorivita sublithincola]AFL80864.1 response regulator containing a CheY-like receiver domain and an HTH DNA-binding domain [Aequorivita sublithincola DSM 14238]